MFMHDRPPVLSRNSFDELKMRILRALAEQEMYSVISREALEYIGQHTQAGQVGKIQYAVSSDATRLISIIEEYVFKPKLVEKE